MTVTPPRPTPRRRPARPDRGAAPPPPTVLTFGPRQGPDNAAERGPVGAGGGVRPAGPARVPQVVVVDESVVDVEFTGVAVTVEVVVTVVGVLVEVDVDVELVVVVVELPPPPEP